MQRRLLVLGLSLLLTACDTTIPTTEISRVDTKGLFAAQFDQRGDLLVMSGVSSPSGLWATDPAGQRFVWHLGNDRNTAYDQVGISRDGRVAVTLSATRLAVWDTQTGKNRQFIDLPKKPQQILLHPNGRWLIIMGIRQAILWDSLQQGAIRSFSVEHDFVASTFDMTGKRWVAQLANQSLALFDIDSGELAQSLSIKTLDKAQLITAYDGIALSVKGGVEVLDTRDGISLSFKKVQGAQRVTQLIKTSDHGYIGGTTSGVIAHWNSNNELIGAGRVDLDREWGTPPTRIIALAERDPNTLLLVGSRGELVSLSLPFAR